MPEHHEFLGDFTDRWEAAWNAHDPEEILGLFASRFTWEDPTFWPNTITTRDELRRYIDKVFDVMPDVHFDQLGRFFDPDQCRGIYLFQQTGSPPQQFPDLKPFRTHGCDIFLDFVDGGLSHYLACYDITEMMRQMGMLPPRAGKIGGAYHLSLLKQR